MFKNYCKYALGQGRVYTPEGAPHMNAQQFHRLVQDAGFVEPEGERSRGSWLGLGIEGQQFHRAPARRVAPLSTAWSPPQREKAKARRVTCGWLRARVLPPTCVQAGRLSTTAVDVVFYRYRPPGARRLGFKEVRRTEHISTRLRS